ncbi:hypothetical protein FP2506_14364 [Fulvimarina pelagi HTCC2506]|uniref:Uncharacterized protein n=1 Tax=Fulvimarina pelagi HTCC2506 TaxID=314231 RepID=Q0G457_9HYPH|nr:hypothetical protein FP2506_14364 [Fulvimarina pelagi HTCC2506]
MLSAKIQNHPNRAFADFGAIGGRTPSRLSSGVLRRMICIGSDELDQWLGPDWEFK